MATSIFFLRFSTVTTLDRLPALNCHVVQNIHHIKIIKYFFILDNYKTIFYTLSNMNKNRPILTE